MAMKRYIQCLTVIDTQFLGHERPFISGNQIAICDLVCATEISFYKVLCVDMCAIGRLLGIVDASVDEWTYGCKPKTCIMQNHKQGCHRGVDFRKKHSPLYCLMDYFALGGGCRSIAVSPFVRVV